MVPTELPPGSGAGEPPAGPSEVPDVTLALSAGVVREFGQEGLLLHKYLESLPLPVPQRSIPPAVS